MDSGRLSTIRGTVVKNWRMSLVLGRFVSTLEHGLCHLLIAVLKLLLEIVKWIVTNRLLYDLLLRSLSGRLLPIIW